MTGKCRNLEGNDGQFEDTLEYPVLSSGIQADGK